MARDAHLSAHLNAISDFATSRDASLCNNYAAFSNLHVVPDLYEIINPRAGANHGVWPSSAVNCGICANLDIVVN
jgi:hypothetical protein